MDKIDWYELIICILLASFGGIVKRLVDQEKNPEEKIILRYYISSAIISLFVGIVVYIFSKNFKVSSLMTMGVTSIAGFIGTPIIYSIANFSFKQIKFIDIKALEEENKKNCNKEETDNAKK